MARKIVVTGRFNPGNQYIDDRGVARSVAVKMVPPAPIVETATTAQLAGIIASGGAEPFKVGATVINDIGDVPCPETDNLTPRRLRFIFSDASSLSVPIASKDNIIQTANSIITNINAVLPQGLTIVCIQEEGERFLDVLAEFNNANFTNTPVAPTNASRYYSGTANYQTDVGNQQLLLPFKILSEDPANPPAVLAQAWQSCVGELNQANFGCGGNSRRHDHRRFIPQFVVNAVVGGGEGSVNGVESHEIPILNRATGEIQNCGQAIVDNLTGSIFCMSYRGHNDSRFHLNPGINLGG